MRFVNVNLSVVAFVSGFTLWQYNHDGQWTDLIDDDFWDVYHLCSVGDKIMCVCPDCYLELIVVDLSDRKVKVKVLNKVDYK